MASKNGKQWEQIMDAARAQGIVVERTSGKRGGHYRATREGYPTIVHLPATPSDYRGIKNSVADMRRWLGFEWKGR